MRKTKLTLLLPLAALMAAGAFFIPPMARPSECEAAYQGVTERYKEQKDGLDAASGRHLAALYRKVAGLHPDCARADDALYMAGVLGIKSFALGEDMKDLESARDAFHELAEKYPDSNLADDGALFEGEVRSLLGDADGARACYRRAIEWDGGDMSDKARERLALLDEKAGPDRDSAAPGKADNKAVSGGPEEAAADGINVGGAGPTDTLPTMPLDLAPPMPASPDLAPSRAPEEEASADDAPDLVAETYGLSPGGPEAAAPPMVEAATDVVTESEDGPDFGSIETVLAGPDGLGTGEAQPPAAAEPDSSGANYSGPAPPGGYAWLEGVRFWSNQDYTRIVIELDREVPYEAPRMLKADRAIGTPPRLYIDFKGALVSPKMADPDTPEPGCFTLPIGDGLLKKARAGQYQPDVARVVLDIERIEHFNAFPLPGDKFRYVIDVYGSRESMPGVAKNSRKKPRDPGGKSPVLGEWPEDREQGRPWWRPSPGKSEPRYVVVLDPGHGGKDPGARGATGSNEKDIALEIAKMAKDEIESSRRDIKVVLTRDDDRFISLVERTAMANTMEADLFVSIHINAARNKEAQGIETYYLDNTTDRAALKLAAKENFVEEKVLADSRDTTNLILADLITSSKVEDSVPLAESLQKSLVASQRERWPDVADKGVKKAPFWVLTGATMPCSLVEVGFLSNREEEKRLLSDSYRRRAAKGIAKGIVEYIDGYHQVSLNQ